MLNLTIDIGNTATKAALFDKGRLVRSMKNGEWKEERFDRAIVVSTRGSETKIEKDILAHGTKFVKFDHRTPVPLKNLYATPETLGYDRLAAAVGAHTLHSDRDVLIVDFGTAITFDIVTAAGEFLGGNISPGARSRFRALHEFTGALPLVGLKPETEENDCEFPSRDTLTAIENGVVTGIVAETEHYIETAMARFGTITTIFTGGDAEYFAKRVKFPIFVVSDLVFYGLNAILEYNANQ